MIRWFHRHRWEVIAARQGRFVIERGMATCVLYRCDCGKTKTEGMAGHWTAEQLRGNCESHPTTPEAPDDHRG